MTLHYVPKWKVKPAGNMKLTKKSRLDHETAQKTSFLQIMTLFLPQPPTLHPVFFGPEITQHHLNSSPGPAKKLVHQVDQTQDHLSTQKNRPPNCPCCSRPKNRHPPSSQKIRPIRHKNRRPFWPQNPNLLIFYLI